MAVFIPKKYPKSEHHFYVGKVPYADGRTFGSVMDSKRAQAIPDSERIHVTMAGNDRTSQRVIIDRSNVTVQGEGAGAIVERPASDVDADPGLSSGVSGGTIQIGVNPELSVNRKNVSGEAFIKNVTLRNIRVVRNQNGSMGTGGPPEIAVQVGSESQHALLRYSSTVAVERLTPSTTVSAAVPTDVGQTNPIPGQDIWVNGVQTSVTAYDSGTRTITVADAVAQPLGSAILANGPYYWDKVHLDKVWGEGVHDTFQFFGAAHGGIPPELMVTRCRAYCVHDAYTCKGMFRLTAQGNIAWVDSRGFENLTNISDWKHTGWHFNMGTGTNVYTATVAPEAFIDICGETIILAGGPNTGGASGQHNFSGIYVYTGSSTIPFPQIGDQEHDCPRMRFDGIRVNGYLSSHDGSTDWRNGFSGVMVNGSDALNDAAYDFDIPRGRLQFNNLAVRVRNAVDSAQAPDIVAAVRMSAGKTGGVKKRYLQIANSNLLAYNARTGANAYSLIAEGEGDVIEWENCSGNAGTLARTGAEIAEGWGNAA